jgi:dTDP-glucose 4,6-dehydratase
MILVTGDAGFIGSNFVLDLLAECDEPIVNLDALTYAGTMANLSSLQSDGHYIFIQANIEDASQLTKIFEEHPPRAVVHFAAESDLDRPMHCPENPVQTNIVWPLRLLEDARAY